MKNPNTQVIYTDESDSFKRLLHLTKTNRQDAKIFAFNSQQNISKTTLLITTKPPSAQFTISLIINNYSVNRNGIMYVKSKQIYSIIFKEGKVWTTATGDKKKIRPAYIYELIRTPFQEYAPRLPQEAINTIRSYINKIPCLNTFKEYPSLNGHLTYNNAIRNKILSVKDRITYALGGIKGEKVIEAFNGNINKAVQLLSRITTIRKQIKPYIYLIDDSKINHEILVCHFLVDTLRMAAVFNTQVKLRWSTKRLKELHDELSKTITLKAAEIDNIHFTISDKLKQLTNFINANTYFKAEIIPSSKELALHGMEMKHCVGTYTNKVQSGHSQILKVTDTKTNEIWTAELSPYYRTQFALVQFRGFSNKSPTDQVYCDFKAAIEAFSNSIKNSEGQENPWEAIQFGNAGEYRVVQAPQPVQAAPEAPEDVF